MLQALANLWNSNKRRQQLTDPRNIGLYIFTIVVLAISWSSVRTVQNNYELQKKISKIGQENAVLELQNTNIELQNKYYETGQYLELAARQNFGLAAPGEKVLLVPKSVALKHVDQSLVKKSEAGSELTKDNRSRFAKNIEDWRDFLLGRQIVTD